MIDKNSLWIMLGLSNIFVLGEIRRVLKDENLVKEFKTKFAEYGKNIYNEYSEKRERVFESLRDESFKIGLEWLLDSIGSRIICFGKKDIDPNLPANTLQCITEAYVKMTVLDAIHPYINAGNYNKVVDVMLYLSRKDVSEKIVDAFRYISWYELGGDLLEILEANKNIDESIKKLDKAFRYASNYMKEAIEYLFHNKEEDFRKKIEYGIQLNPYKDIRNQIKEILREAFGSHS